MKRIIAVVSAMMLFTAPIVNGQDGVTPPVEKFNKAAAEKRVAKSDADIANPKKAVKAATWIKRGDMFYEVATQPANGIFRDLQESMMVQAQGDAPKAEVTVDGNKYTEYTYEHFKAYVSDGRVKSFFATTEVDPEALAKSEAAYVKAYELDPKSEKKVVAGLKNLMNAYFERGNNFLTMGDYAKAADNYYAAFKAGEYPVIAAKDTNALYNAGYCYLVSNQYKKGAECFEKAIEYGKEDNGDVYYYAFLCEFQDKQMDKAEKTIKEGIAKYPGNTNIIEGLIKYYASVDKNPNEIIPLVNAGIEKDPKNPLLYYGLGLIYDKLGDLDSAIAEMHKAQTLKPDDFYILVNLGLFYSKKGDALNAQMNQRGQWSGTEEYQASLKKVNDEYAKALPYLEKAYEVNPSEKVTVEILKSLTFRLRDMPGMQAKYDKYKAIFDSMQ